MIDFKFIFKKMISFLILMSLLFECSLPAFAIKLDASTLEEPKKSSKIYQSNPQTEFPDTLNEFMYVKHLEGGSGGVHVLKNSSGQFFTLKMATEPEHLKEEILADALLKALGIYVPDFAVYDDFFSLAQVRGGPGLYRLAHFIIKNEEGDLEQAITQEMQKSFVANAFLSNFDIVGGGFKNVILDNQERLFQIDNGGSLRFRAMGGLKIGSNMWKPYRVMELETMRDERHGNKESVRVYESLQDTDILVQTQEILKRSSLLFSTLDHVASVLSLNGPEDVREMLRCRLDDLVARFISIKIKSEPVVSTFMEGYISPQFASGIFVHSLDPTGQKVVLLGKRKGHNWWCNFGGKMDVSDQSLAETAVRETQEESLGNLSFTPRDLTHVSSHAILTDSVFYRMYIASHPFREAGQFLTSSPVEKHEWYHEYTEYRWVPFDEFLKEFNPAKEITEEGKDTYQMGEGMILYPPFWKMLQEPQVRQVLTKIYEKGDKAAAHPSNRHTHHEAIEPIFSKSHYLSLKDEEAVLASATLQKTLVGRSIKARLTEDRSVIDSEKIKSMSGYLNEAEAAKIKEDFQACPYTQTEAYLRGSIKEEDFDRCKESSHEQVEMFLSCYATPSLPSDEHYINVLSQVLETEKRNREKTVFYHATDPLTCFLWDIFSAYRSHLKMGAGGNLTVLRALDDKFGNILDVQQFMELYKKDNKINNYATVEGIHYADLGLSVNPFLFGNNGHLTSSTSYLFYNTNSVKPTQQEALFNYFMAVIGVPGKFKDYQAIFNQHYIEGNQINAQLFQIFIEPHVVDTVSYVAVAGGDALTCDIEFNHKFTQFLAQIRRDPSDVNEILSQEGKTLNTVQGRIFLQPDILHNEKLVRIEKYWRYPMKDEGAYRKALNAQIIQNLTEWLPQKDGLSDDLFFDGVSSLKQLYKYVYEGHMQIPFRGKDVKFGLAEAIRQGNVALMAKIFKENANIDLNTGFPNSDYRSQDALSVVPVFELLSCETPNFSEVVKILVENKATQINLTTSFEFQDKLLNELVGDYFNQLSGDLLMWADRLIAEKFNFLDQGNVLRHLINFHQKKYENLLSFKGKEVKEFLQKLFIERAEIIKRGWNVETLTELDSPTMTSIMGGSFLSSTMMRVMGLLSTEKEDKGDDFQILWKHMIMNVNDYIPKSFKSGNYLFALSLLKETRVERLDLTTMVHLSQEEVYSNFLEALALNKNLKIVELGNIESYFNPKHLEDILNNPQLSLEVLDLKGNYGKDEVDYIAKALATNQTLQDILCSTVEIEAYLVESLLSQRDSGIFQQSPWFQKMWKKMIESPSRYDAPENASFVPVLLSVTQPVETIDLGDVLFVIKDKKLSDALIEALALNTHIKTLKIKKISTGNETLSDLFKRADLFEHLETVEVQKIYSKDFPVIVEALKENKTLKKLKIPADTELTLIESLMDGKDREEAPWLKEAWQKMLKDPTPYLKFSHPRVIERLLIQASQNINLGKCFKSSAIVGKIFIDLLKTNQVFKTTSLNLSGEYIEPNAFYEAFLEALKKNTSFTSLNLEGCQISFGSFKNLLEALKENKTLECLMCSEDLMFKIMKQDFSEKDDFKTCLWFKKAGEDILDSPKYIKLMIFEGNYDLLSFLIATTARASLDLTRVVVGKDVQWKAALEKGQKGNPRLIVTLPEAQRSLSSLFEDDDDDAVFGKKGDAVFGASSSSSVDK